MRPHLYKKPCPSVGWLVSHLVMLSSKLKNGLLRILNDLGSAGRGGKRDEEEGGTGRKEGRGRKRDWEERGTGRKKGRGEWKNENVQKDEKRKSRLRTHHWPRWALLSYRFHAASYLTTFSVPLWYLTILAKVEEVELFLISPPSRKYMISCAL